MPYTFVPTFIRETQAELPRAKISAEHWNGLFNRIIIQGDANAEALHELINLRTVVVGPIIRNAAGVVQEGVLEIQFTNSDMFVDDGRLYVSGLQGPVGPLGPEGPQGAVGPQGATGNSFVIHGNYPTLLALQTAIPVGTDGAAYVVGDATVNTVYFWDEVSTSWVDIGPIKGPKGDTGATGPAGATGATGPMGPEGPAGDTTAFNAHTGDLTIHITGTERATWNAKSNLALGEAAGNAYRGDRGVIAYNHSQATHATVPTGAVTSVIANDLTANRAMISDAFGKIAASTVTAAEVGNLTGLSGNIMTLLNGKLGVSAQAADSLKVGGRTIYHSTTEPAGAVNGDIWLKPAA